MSSTSTTVRRVAGGVVLFVALAAAGGVAAADLTGVLATDPADSAEPADGGDPAAAVGEATRAGAGTAVCPAVADGEEPARLVVAPATDGETEVRVLRYGGERVAADEAQTVSGDAPLVVDLAPGEAAAPVGVRWRGDPVTVSWVAEGPPSAAGPCEPYPQPVWHVGGFDTTLESASTLHLVNPYTRDAVVRVTFATPDGESVLARTDNVLIAGGTHRALDVTDLEPEYPELAATVETLAGRVMAQGEVRIGTTSEEDGPEGRALLPGVPDTDAADTDAADTDADADAAADTTADATAPELLAATGARAGDDATSWLVVHNLDPREEGLFRVRVTDPDEEAPRHGAETGVAPGGVTRVDLDGLATTTEFAVAVEPLGDESFAATRLTAVTTGSGQDVSAEVLRPLGRELSLGAAASDRGRVTVANFGGATTSVDVDAGPATPDDWAQVPVGPGERATFDLADTGGEGAVPLRVTAADPVAVGLTRRDSGAPLSLWSLGAVDARIWDAAERPPARRDRALPGRLAPQAPTEPDGPLAD